MEVGILKWAGEGKTNEEIGFIIKKTKWTVKFHLKNIMRKLDVVSRTQAVSRAMAQNLFSPLGVSSLLKMKPKLKICIIGLGKGGTAILDIFKGDPSLEIVGVADVNPLAKGIKFAKSLNIPVVADYRK